MPSGDDTHALLVKILGVVALLFPDACFQARQLLGWDAYDPANLLEVFGEVLIADDEVDAQLVIDDVETIIVEPVTFDVLGKYFFGLAEVVIGDTQMMIEALPGGERGVTPLFPKEKGSSPVPGVSAKTQFEIRLPYLGRQPVLYRLGIVVLLKVPGVKRLVYPLAIVPPVEAVIPQRCDNILAAAVFG